MTEARRKKFKHVASQRQEGLTLVLENVHDPHNISAVLRTADSVGLQEIFVLYTEPQLTEEHLRLGTKSSSGALRWVKVHLFHEVEACFELLKSRYTNIMATHLGANSVSLYELDLTASTALVFGNEKDGISEASLQHCTGNFLIPQMGMVESLNISVACAVSLYEGLRQRDAAGYYGEQNPLSTAKKEELFDTFCATHESKIIPKSIFPYGSPEHDELSNF